MHLKKLENLSSFGKLKRFLLYGTTSAMAAVTIRFDMDCLSEILSILDDLKENMPKVIMAIEDIHDFALRMKTHYIACIPFVLAALSKIPEHRHLAHETAWTLLKSFEEFVHFVRFSEMIPPFENDEIFKDTIQKWCESHDPQTLAEMHARVEQEYEGYSLKTIMALGNVFTSDDPSSTRSVVYECVHHGVVSAWEKYENDDDPEAVELLVYLFNFSRLEELDEHEALPIISEHSFKPDQIASKHLMDVSTWMRIIRFMDIEDLTLWAIALSEKLFFRNTIFVDMLYNYLKDELFILAAKVHPNKCLIAEKKMSERLSQSSCLRLLASKIEEALKIQKEIAFQNIEKREINVTLIIDCHVLDDAICGKFVKSSEAAAMIACSLAHFAQDIKALTFNGFKEINIKCEDFTDAQNQIESLSCQKTSAKAVKHYLKDDTSSDLCVFVGQKISHTDYIDLICQDNFIERKFVFCSLGENDFEESKNDHNILVIPGFNEITCELIEGFANCV